MMVRSLPALFVMLLPAGGMAAEPFGRLFFTPEQRASIDSERVAESQSAMLGANGAVIRPDGKSTVWLNGQPRYGNDGSDGIRASVDARRPENVSVVDGKAGSTVLRIGEAMNRHNGKRSDIVAPGAIRILHGPKPD